MPNTQRLVFGARKYTAYNLMIARWHCSGFASQQRYCYVTMGGTEMYDIVNFSWVNQNKINLFVSFEEDLRRFELAEQTAKRFNASGLNVQMVRGDLFDYRRMNDEAHVFFVDLEDICSLDHYLKPFHGWFNSDTIQSGDLLLITSYLGRNSGWDRTLRPFEGEFRSLRTNTFNEKKKLYKAMHPAFVVNRALLDSGLNEELKMTCIGHVKYRDTSSMGLYGFAFEEGRTNFSNLVKNVPSFDTITKQWANSIGI